MNLSNHELKQLEMQTRAIAKKYMEKPAWGVVWFAALTIIAFATSTLAVIFGVMPMWLGFILNIIFCYFLFTPIHESVHHTINGSRRDLDWVNNVVGWVCGIVALLPYKGFRCTHLRHHQNTNDPKNDPDYWVHSDSTWKSLAKTLLQVPAYIYHWFAEWKPTREDHRREIRIALTHHIIALIFLITSFYFGFGWYVLFLWYLPSFLGIALDAILFDWLVHKPHTSTERFYDTSVYLFPKPFHRLTAVAMLWQNYHLVHHLYARIPFYRYGKAFYEMRPILEKIGAPIKDLSKSSD